MPIEIRELVIKATVTQDSGNTGAKATVNSGNDVPTSEDIVNICVEKILGILKEKNER
jgi:hypothetical protein